MWIKICANTNLADAQLAAELGADALGFVFAPSKRQVTIDQVAAILPQLAPPNPIETIAVVQSRDPAEILDLVRRTGVTGVQLHGGFDLALIHALHAELGSRIQLIQALHWTIDEDAESAQLLAGQLRQIAAEPAITRVLLDAKVGNATGGTGRTFDWQAARETLAGATGPNQPISLIVAGGLRPENVAAAIHALRPWGVDVASGVEASPCRKDPQQLRSFLANAREA